MEQKFDLLKSNGFWTLILNIVLACIAYYVAHYVVNAQTADMITFFATTIEPLFVFLIAHFTIKDVEAIRANAKVAIARQESAVAYYQAWQSAVAAAGKTPSAYFADVQLRPEVWQDFNHQ